MRNAARRQNRTDAVAQAGAIIGDALQGIGLVEDFQALLGGGERHRMRRVGTAVGNAPTDLAHDLLAAGQHGNRIPIAERLGEGA